MESKPVEGDGKSKKRRLTGSEKRELNAQSAGQSLWLVKVPQFVAEAWAEAKNDDVLGSLMVAAKPGKEGAKQMIVMLDPKLQNTGIPEQYALDEVKSSAVSYGNTMMAFNVDDQSRQFSIDGIVTKSLALKPPDSADYQNIVHNRSMQEIAGRKQIKVVNLRDLERTSKQSYTIEFLSSVRGELKRKAAGGKTDVDINSLKTKVFEAFEQDEHQAFDAILAMCKDVAGFSREQDLRDVLEKYAAYHHRGPFRGTWELKSQFRVQMSTAESSAST